MSTSGWWDAKRQELSFGSGDLAAVSKEDNRFHNGIGLEGQTGGKDSRLVVRHVGLFPFELLKGDSCCCLLGRLLALACAIGGQ